jgi:outer membrane protein
MRIKIIFILVFTSVTFSFSQKKWSLQDCVDYALENNLTIKRNEQTNLLNEISVENAKSNKLPGVSGSASQNFNFGSGIDFATNSRINTRTSSNNFGVNASVTVFNGFKIKNSILQSEKNLEISQLDLQKMKNDISLNIVNSYLNILFNKESLKVAEAKLEISNKQLERTKQLVDAGTQPRGNLLEIEATIANDENAIVVAQNNIDLALLSLSQILQISNQGFDVDDINITLNSVSLLYNNTNDIFAKSVTLQPEIKSAELNLENTETAIEIAKADFLPTVSLSGGINTAYSNVSGNGVSEDSFFTQLDNNFGQFVGLSVNIPIFSKGQVKQNVNRQKINREIAKINLDDEKRALREAIERAYINAKATLKEYEAAEKSVKAQQQSFDFAQERYQIGATNSFDFEQVKNRLINAQSALIRAKYNYVFRTKLLEYYYGIPIVIE